MSTVFDALLGQASEDDLKQLAAKLAPFLTEIASPPAPEWFNLEQACEYLATKPSRIYALRSAGRIPYHKDGSRLMFNRHELEEWVRKGGGVRP